MTPCEHVTHLFSYSLLTARRHRGVGECTLFARTFVVATPAYSFSAGSMVLGGGLDASTSAAGGLGTPSRLMGGRSLDGSMALAREGVCVVCPDEIQLYTGTAQAWKDSTIRDPTK